MQQQIYQIGLVLCAILEWSLMYRAKFEEYDVNYGLAIYAFLLSILAFLIIVVLWFRKRDLLKSNKWLTMFFLVTSSPLSLYLFIYLYGKFIGQYFNL
jgi:amino acid permease